VRLACAGVTVRHGATVALEDVSVDLRPGEHVLLAGLSGSGKTTLLKVLAGLQRPSAGQVTWDGEPVESLSEAERRRRQAAFGMVFQTDALFDSRTVRENVLLPLRNRGVPGPEAASRADSALASVGLSAAADRSPDALSGGMRKRAGMARALAVSPAVLFADDPLAGQDPATARSLCELLARESAGRSLVVSAPEPLDALALPRWWVMHRGRLVHDGPPAPGLLDTLEEA
jgi:phospholipid/cholesterol/gamma-HCH transport system ATP-binding protein